MADVDKEIVITVRGVDALSGTMSGTEKQLQATSARLQAVGSQMRMAGVAITAVGAAGLIASDRLVKGAAETEEAYARVNTMLGAGEDALADYGDAIKSLTREIPIQGGEVAALDGMYQVLSAGIERGADATMVLEAAMKAAVGGMTNTETSVDILTTALNAYSLAGDQATWVTDVLAKTVQLGKTTYDSLAGALGPVLSIAAQLNVGLDQVSATMATLTKAGIQTDIAATSLRATMVSLLNPSTAMEKALKDLGHASGSALLEAEGFQGALEKLSASVGGSAEAMTELFPNVRALTAVLPLTGEMASVAADDLEAMGDAAGTAQDMFSDMASTTSAQLEILNNRFQQARDSIALGATPAMLKLREGSVRAMEGLAALNEETNGAVGAMFVLGSAIMTTVGPIVAAIGQYTLYRAAKIQIAILTAKETAAYNTNSVALGVQTGATGAATTASWSFAGALTAVKAAATSMMGILGLAVLAIVGLTLAIGAAFKAFDDFKQETEKVRDSNRDLMNAMDDGTETFKDRKKAIDDLGRVQPRLAEQMTLTTMEQHAQSEAFVKGTDDALALRDAYIDLRSEEVKELKAAEDATRGALDLSDARADLRKEIKEDADALFGAVLTESQALVILTHKYNLSNDAAMELIETTGRLTTATLSDAMAAAQAARERNDFLIQMSIANEQAAEASSLLGSSSEELEAKLASLNAEREIEMALMARAAESDAAQAAAHGLRAANMGDEIALVEDMIAARGEGIASIDETATAYDRYTDSVIGTFAATQSLADSLAGLEFAPALDTQLSILEKKLGRVAETWASVFGTEGFEDVDAERMQTLFMEEIGRIPEMIAQGRTGEEIMESLVFQLRAAGVEVSDAIFNILKEYVSAYLELHSPAKKGPLHNIDTYWEPMGEMLTRGLKRGVKRSGPAGMSDGVTSAADMMGAGPRGKQLPAVGGGPSIHIESINFTGYSIADMRRAAREFTEEMEDIWMEG